MGSGFFTNDSEQKFIDKLKQNIDLCRSFCFSVSFIKKPGLRLIAPNLEAALARGVKGRLITSTYQNFTDVDSLLWFLSLQDRYPGNFTCRLDRECFRDQSGNAVGFHTKGYLFSFPGHNELLVGSSNITVYALLKNVEWDVSVIAEGSQHETVAAAQAEFDRLWERTMPLTRDLIEEYKIRLYYSIERWDMDYEIANAAVRPNYMQRRALKELNRIRAMGASRALICAAAGSGKTYLAAFDALNFNPKRLLYVVQEGSILMKSFQTFQHVFGSDRSYGIYNKDFKELDAQFLFSTNITMANSLEVFSPHAFDYVIIDECHHATAETYRKIIEYFSPQFLLGITATPERMDGEDVFGLFDENVPYELRLRDAIINGLVVPFKYYGIRDELIEYGINETKGHRFVEQFSDEKHCDFIYQCIEKHRLPGQKLKALAFCRDISHAIRMSQAMEDYYHTQYLTGRNSVGERIRAYKDLQDDSAQLEILFTVDILNEGVDIPGVNMVLFLRPTDSQTIFIQQLGRGLRKYEGKQYVTVLDFIGNDYKRSVQIAFALGSLSENFVVEKQLVVALIADNFASIGLVDFGVEIHIDDLSKKEILSYIDAVNFNTLRFLKQDYQNFKKYISAAGYPRHVDYLNNDYAPDLLKFMQSKTGGRKNASYYGFLQAIGEDDLPAFDERQESFVRYVSEMLPIVRPYEYLIIQRIVFGAGKAAMNDVQDYMQASISEFREESFRHALRYILASGYFEQTGGNMGEISFKELRLNVELDEYLRDLLDYGLGQYEVERSVSQRSAVSQETGESSDVSSVSAQLLIQPFHLWAKYRKEQVQLLLCNNPKDIMKGTMYYGKNVYIYVTVIKSSSTKDDLKYVDGYLDTKTFQWETVAHIRAEELRRQKDSDRAYLFVRKVESEDGIVLPFTFIGTGKMLYIEGSEKTNGAHLYRIEMDVEAPEDLYFDFKLPE